MEIIENVQIILLIIIVIVSIMAALKLKFVYSKIFKVIFLLMIIVFWGISIYINTDTIYDFFMVNIYCIAVFSVLGFVEKITRKNTYLCFVFYMVNYTIIFFAMKLVNKHLLDAIDYMYIVLCFIGFIKIVYKKKDKDLMIVANIIGIIIVYILYHNFPESYFVRTKQECVVMNYLDEVEDYNNKDIVEITDMSPSSSNREKKIFVSIKDKGGFIYYYEDGEIINVEEVL
ncbi:hypothetical protein SH1V18_44320 [Vallitalea longa]|uniref:Uncharacterized protein n=1 Tax=Vallitalea longa TaxID=2936439 RepID=A0A9W6DHV0_9FIRM|nr:hypothetical protein [Vallitalea longa]GKX31952.1 hypothetical protein SH1V18_44320 [Vallitalea longa]